MVDERQFSPSTERNRAPIFAQLQRIFPVRANVLEVSSGSGEHAVWMTEHTEHWTWQPTDVDAQALKSIAAWRERTGTERILPPRRVDVLDDSSWLIGEFDAAFNANMIHIAPEASTRGLFRCVATALKPQGIFAVYGPFRRAGVHTAESNQRFDDWLTSQDPDWGVRDLEQVVSTAEEEGFTQNELIPMPANNYLVVFQNK